MCKRLLAFIRKLLTRRHFDPCPLRTYRNKILTHASNKMANLKNKIRNKELIPPEEFADLRQDWLKFISAERSLTMNHQEQYQICAAAMIASIEIAWLESLSKR